MSHTPVVSACYLAASSKEARDKVYDYIHEIVEYAKLNEPDVVKYAVCVPEDAESDTTIYTFEEYTNRAAWERHMASEPVVKFLNLTKEDESLLRPETLFRHLTWIPDAYLSRSSRLPTGTSHDLRDRVEHPYVLWATITDPQTADIDALAPYGAAVVKFARDNEPDTLFYSDARAIDLTPNDSDENDKGGFIAALEVYASKEACFAHLQDNTVKALAVEGKRLDSTFTIVKMNMVEGYLTKE